MLDQVPAVEGRKNGRAGNYPPAEEPDAEAKDQVLQPGGAHLSFKLPPWMFWPRPLAAVCGLTSKGG